MKNKILIVDDEPMLLTALADKFTRKNFEVITAKNGKEGLTSALENRPDIILLDVIMPVMDGKTMLYELRKDDWGKNVKIILLTNLSDPAKITRSMLEMTSGYLEKAAWKIEDIVKYVRKVLEG